MQDARVYFQKLRHTLEKYWPVLLIAAVGVVLLCWPESAAEDAAQPEVIEDPAEWNADTAAFEQQLAALLTQAAGVGRAEVLLTIRQDMEYLYLEERSQSRDARGTADAVTETAQQETVQIPILRDAQGGEAPVLRSRRYPIYQGAVIVCDGADQPGVRLTVINAVSALTGLSSDRITVMKMK